MIYDIHAHIVGPTSGQGGNYLCPERRMSLPLRLMLRRMRRRVGEATDPSTHERLAGLLGQWIAASRVDRVVMLALDGVYRRDGTADWDSTRMVVGNDYVADFVAGNPKLLFGASIHPYRKDALEQLDRVVARGACLIKWLPSAQNIAPDDPRCAVFYDRLARHRIPLLTHTGVEHTLAQFSNALNEPRRLVAALRRGVTVIAAHCGTRMYLYERSWFGEWANIAKEYETFYGDLSTFGLPLRGGPLRRILRDPELLNKVLYGSDFPVPTFPPWFGLKLGWRKAMMLQAVRNPFDKALQTMEELGVPREVFSRAGEMLRLPAAPSVMGGAR